MPAPKKPASPTLTQRIAALEGAFLKQATDHDALKEVCRKQSVEIADLRRGGYGQAAWFDDAVAETESRILKRVAEQQSLDRIGKLNREFRAEVDFGYKELRRMREEAATLSGRLRQVEKALVSLVNIVDDMEQYWSGVEESWPEVESTITRADKAVREIQSMLGKPAGPEPRLPLATAVDILEHKVGAGSGRIAALERQFGDILRRFATGRPVLPPSGEPPVVAAPDGSPASAFPADGLVKVAMGEIGGRPCPVVDARELHSFIGSKDNFSNWISDQIERARLKENKHFVCTGKNLCKKPGRGGHNRIDYFLSLHGAIHVAMSANTDKAFEVRDYFIECEERLREILSRPAQQASLREASDIGPSTASTERQATPDETLPVHYYTAADPLFMACIALTEKTVLHESEGDEWKSTRTFRPANDMLMRNAKALAHLLRAVPRNSAGWRYTQYELAIQSDLTACHLRESLGHLEALEFVAIKRINRGKPGPTFELRMLWENIEAAARRDGVDLAALAGTPAGAVPPAALARG